jgi:hypothetical protein
MRCRSRRAFSSSDRVSLPGSTCVESTNMRVWPLARSYSHKSRRNRLLSRPRRKVTREPSGAILGFIRLGPDNGASPVSASRVSFSALAGVAIDMANDIAMNGAMRGAMNFIVTQSLFVQARVCEGCIA